jgi:mxaJ protein
MKGRAMTALGNMMTLAPQRPRRTLGVLCVPLFLAALWPNVSAARGTEQDGREFRVCADPNNLPFSSVRGDGFENKLAELFARDLGETVSYTWWAERRGFIRNTLKAGKCDVVLGVPVKLDMVETTRPYYRSGYVFVSRADRHLDISSMIDPRLKTLRIGVQLLGNNGFNTPPAHALAEQGIVEKVVGYPIYGDYRQLNPPARIVDAVAKGAVDIAAVWGPLAGYLAKQSPVPLTVRPIADTAQFAPLLFQFDIAVGVRKGDDARRAALDAIIERRHAEIAAILDKYGVPEMPADGSPK